MDIAEKMDKFKEDCLMQAKKEAEELEKEIIEQVENQVKDEMEPYNIRQEIKFNRAMKKIEKDYFASLYALESEKKQKIIKKQEELKEDFRLNLKEKIINFTKSQEYKDYLLDSIKKAVQNITENENEIILYITENDINLYGAIVKKEYPNVQIESIDNTFLGGCRCFNKSKKIFMDNTLSLAIEEQVKDRRW